MIQNIILIIIIIIMSVVVIRHMLNDPNGRPVYHIRYDDTFIIKPISLYIDTNAGSYTINTNLQFTFDKKPNLFHRTFTRVLLGWKWTDNE